MTTLILIRHGETDWNLEGRYSGQTDVPLNTNGKRQARKTAERLQNQKIDAIYSSDLIRAQETAEALGHERDIPLHLDARLREINQGQWEGMHIEEIRTRYAEAWKVHKENPLSVAPPGGETVGQVRARVFAAVADILHQHPKAVIAIVSHGLSLALLRAHVANAAIEEVWDFIPAHAEPEWIQMEA